MDENTDNTTEQQPAGRERMGRRAWVRSTALIGTGLVAGGILAGTLTATAADTGTTAADSTSSSTTEDQDGDGDHGGPGNGDPSQPQRSDEQLLTGDTATKVTDVVTAKYPDATIERVETDSDGVYEAHIVNADGTHLTVQVGKDLAITGTDSHGR
jgi:hypothetical protein